MGLVAGGGGGLGAGGGGGLVAGPQPFQREQVRHGGGGPVRSRGASEEGRRLCDGARFVGPVSPTLPTLEAQKDPEAHADSEGALHPLDSGTVRRCLNTPRIKHTVNKTMQQ